MKYYKIIKDAEFIGVVTSNNFIYYSTVAQCFLRTDETMGEYVSYSGKLYRNAWMQPITEQREFIEADVIQIEEEEYNTYITAIANNETIRVEVEEQEYEEDEPEVNESEVTSLEFIRSSKLKELSRACRTTIEAGIDIELRGEAKHFSLNTQDQLNLMSLEQMIQHQSMVPYHADEEKVVFYSAEEMQEIIDSANAFKIYHTTYHNALKGWVNALNNIEDIGAIQYGDEIPEQYKTDVLKALEV